MSMAIALSVLNELSVASRSVLLVKKISCELCQNHCYAPEMQERIREVMRYAGPRMIWHHPIAAIRHLATKFNCNRAAKRLMQAHERC